MSVNYKTLAEIKLFHEYFLTRKDGTSIFEKTTQDDRLNYLLEEFSDDKEAVNAHIDFSFPEELKSRFEGSYLKLLPTYSGCKIMIRVNQRVLADKSIVYEPLTPFDNQTDLYILITKRSGLIDTYTSSKLNNPLPAIYLFSNESGASLLDFPFLTTHISDYRSVNQYEQGELASFGLNDTREYYSDEAVDQWAPVKGNAFANENDRMLLPSRFHYSFRPDAGVKEVSFTLKDKDGNPVKSIAVKEDEPIGRTLLDFSDLRDTISLPGAGSFPGKKFSLVVDGNNGYSRTHQIVFSDSLYSRSTWAVLHIKGVATNPAYRVVDTDGRLFKRTDPLGVRIPHPVFEIPVKSRSAYWRYMNDKGKKIKLIDDLKDYLFQDTSPDITKDKLYLLTKRPRMITRSYFFLDKPGSSDKKYVPNPTSYELNKDDDGRLCFDVRVPESALFPVI